VLRALKSDAYSYRDATNVVGFYSDELEAPGDIGDRTWTQFAAV
jgi:hypothetical protein